MRSDLPTILAQALEAIERGELTPADCLELFAGQRDELAGLLAAIAEVQRAPAPEPDPAFRAAARERLLALCSHKA